MSLLVEALKKWCDICNFTQQVVNNLWYCIVWTRIVIKRIEKIKHYKIFIIILLFKIFNWYLLILQIFQIWDKADALMAYVYIYKFLVMSNEIASHQLHGGSLIAILMNFFFLITSIFLKQINVYFIIKVAYKFKIIINTSTKIGYIPNLVYSLNIFQKIWIFEEFKFILKPKLISVQHFMAICGILYITNFILILWDFSTHSAFMD